MGVIDDLKDNIPGKGSDSSGNSRSSGRKRSGGGNRNRSNSRGNDSLNSGSRNSQPGNPGSAGSLNSDLGDTSFDSSLDDDLGGGNSRDPSGQQGGSPRSQNGQNPGGNRNQGNQPPAQQRNSSRNSRSGFDDSPNTQAGRPQQGGSEPQLSSQTQKKMENAGLDAGQGRTPSSNNSQRGRAANQPQDDSVAANRSDIEELKSQNQQIIELLKRINQSLNGQNQGRQR